MKSIIIPRRVLSIANSCAKENSRYALNCVRIERDPDGACRAVATDGKQIAVVEWTTAEVATDWFGEIQADVTPLELNIQKSDCDRINKSWPKGRHPLRPELLLLTVDGDNLAVSIPGDSRGGRPYAEIQTRAVEGRYPQWRDVVPSRIGMIRLTLGTDVLAQLIKTRDGVTNDKTQKGIDLYISPRVQTYTRKGDEGQDVDAGCAVVKCVRIEAPNGVVGAIMPLSRGGEGLSEGPTSDLVRSDKIDRYATAVEDRLTAEIDSRDARIFALEAQLIEAQHACANLRREVEWRTRDHRQAIDEKREAEEAEESLRRELADLRRELESLRQSDLVAA